MTAREARHQVMLVEWKERVIACRSSGQTVRRWCEEQGICSKTYYNWEREVLRTVSEQLTIQDDRARFVELPVPKTAPEQRGSKTRVAARLYTGKATLELYDGIRAEVAAALCGVFGHAE